LTGQAETRPLRTGWTVTGQTEARAFTLGLERASRGRTLTHAGQYRRKQDIDTKTGQDRLVRQAEARLLLTR
jgi:hypothetical protein